MFKTAFMQAVRFVISSLFSALPIFGVWYMVPSVLPLQAFYASCALAGVALTIAFMWYHIGGDIFIVYGIGFSTLVLIYAVVYYAHTHYGLLDANSFFWTLTVIALVTGYVAVRFHGRLLALVGLGMALMAPFAVIAFMSRYFLAWYCVLFLGIVMIVAYVRRWFELAVLAFLGFLAYNPHLFSHTDLEGTKGFLSIYQVLELMVAIFIMYTVLPWLYSLCCPKKRIFESVCFAIGGAYTAAIIHFVIANQLSLVAQLPFFIRYFVIKGAPVMQDVYMYIFVVYGGVYLCLFLALYLINRQAKVQLGTLACLVIICTVGIMYTHAQATGLLPTVIRVKKLVEQAVQAVQAQ